MKYDKEKARKPQGYWNNLAHVDEAILDFIKNHGIAGIMPTNAQLRQHGYNGLADAISRKHDGYVAAAKRLGLSMQDKAKPDNFWDDFANIEQAIYDYNRERGIEGIMPTYTDLQKAHLSSLAAAISRKHGGFEAVAARLKLAYKPHSQTNGYWANFANVKRELYAYAQLYGTEGIMPTHRELQRHGYTSLSSAITQHHEGIHQVAQRMKWQMRHRQKPRGYWTLDHLREELFTYIREYGTEGVMPTKGELIKNGRADLDNVISKQDGGYPAITQIFGLQGSGKKPNHYWDNFDALAQELLQFIAAHGQLGVMPTQRVLQLAGRYDLAVAIQNKHGGLFEIAHRLNLEYTTIEKISAKTAEDVKRIVRAIQPLAESNLLSGAQIMIILRRTGLLTYRNQRVVQLNASLVHGKHEEIEEALKDLRDDIEEPIVNVDLLEEASTEEYTRTAVETLVSSDLPFDKASPSQEYSSPQPKPDISLEQTVIRGLSALGALHLPLDETLSILTSKLLWESFYKRLYTWYGSLPIIQEITPEDTCAAIFSAYPEHTENEFIAACSAKFLCEVEEAINFAATLSNYGWQGPRLRLHQAVAACRMMNVLTKNAQSTFLLNADDPGMGKSAAFLAAVAGAGIHSVVLLAPKTVADDTWASENGEIHRFLPGARIVRGVSQALQSLSNGSPRLTFWILHYEELANMGALDMFVSQRFDCLCIDEVHLIKQRAGQEETFRRTAVEQLRKAAETAIGLTGTPLVNELAEPLSILQTLSLHDPQFDYVRLSNHRMSDVADVFEVLLPHIIRRRKKDVLLHLPSCDVQVIELPLYEDLDLRVQEVSCWPKARIGVALGELRKLSLEAKLPYIRERAKKAQKLLILTYLTDEISEKIREDLDDFFPRQVAHINGLVPTAERQDILKKFRDTTGVRILIGTIGTIGVGLTLFDPEQDNTTHEIIIADLPYTAAEFDQGVARLHREGQRHRVLVDVLLTTTSIRLRDQSPLRTIDQQIWKLILNKRELSDIAIDGMYQTTDASGKVQKALRLWLEQVRTIGIEPLVAKRRPVEQSEAQQWRGEIARLRGMSATKADERFADPGYTQAFLDHLRTSPASKLAHQWLRGKLERLLRPNLEILDMGCGLNPFADLPCHVIGLDRHSLPGQVKGKLENPPFSNASADVLIYSLSLYGTNDDLRAYFVQAQRVLRAGGHLLIVEPESAFTLEGISRFVQDLQQFGFELVGNVREIIGEGGLRLKGMHFTLTGEPGSPEKAIFARK